MAAFAFWVMFAISVHELITGRLRALMAVAVSVTAVGLVMPLQNSDIVHGLSATVILLAMAGHSLRVEDGGDRRFLALVTGVWVSQLIWAQPWSGSFDLHDAAQWLIQTGLFLFGVKTIGMVTSALSVSERRYGSVFGAAPVGMIEADFSAVGDRVAELPVSDPDGLQDYFSTHPDQITEAISLLEIQHVNRAALDLMRVDSRRALVQQLAKTSGSPQALEAFTQQLVAIWQQRAVLETTFTAKRGDGSELEVLLGTTFPVDANRELILSRAVVSITDLSGSGDALEFKDDLLASVGHQLRTPLTSVAGFSRELTDRPGDFDDTEKAETVAIIAQEADTLSHVVDNLLAASRGDLSTLPLHMEPVDMPIFLALMSLDLGVRHSGKRLHFGPCEALVYADQHRLRQIMRNLIDNAVTYGGEEITIDAVTDGEDGIITVSDNGAGLPPGQEDQAFERVQRSARTNEGPISLGLGLPVASNLAQAMGGALTYSRRDGQTTFQLRLPLPPPSALTDTRMDTEAVESDDALLTPRIPA